MIRLAEITPDNWSLGLSVAEHPKYSKVILCYIDRNETARKLFYCIFHERLLY